MYLKVFTMHNSFVPEIFHIFSNMYFLAWYFRLRAIPLRMMVESTYGTIRKDNNYFLGNFAIKVVWPCVNTARS